MSEHERGAYTPPTDEPLSFDARQPVRGARPFPFTLVISALVLIGLVAAIFIFYRSGVRQAGQAPQTVGEPVGAITAAPPAEAQPTDPAAGLQIYNDDGATTPPAPQFTPPPEQPQPRAETPAVVVAPPAAAPTTPVTTGPALRPALPAAPPPEAPAAKAAATQPPKPAAPAQAKPAAPTTTAAAAPKTAGAAAVQIGAYSSQALAEKGLADAAAIAGGGHGRSIERIQKNGSTLFRTAVTGFASRAEASAYCAKLKAAGKACFVR